MALDAVRYGFVILKYYELSSGFAEDECQNGREQGEKQRNEAETGEEML